MTENSGDIMGVFGPKPPKLRPKDPSAITTKFNPAGNGVKKLVDGSYEMNLPDGRQLFSPSIPYTKCF